MPKLTEDHRTYVLRLLRELREANKMVWRFDKEWHAMNDALKERYAGQDPVQVAKKMGENLILQDALAAGKWWREQSMMLSNAIIAEKAAAEMLTGGAEWEV